MAQAQEKERVFWGVTHHLRAYCAAFVSAVMGERHPFMLCSPDSWMDVYASIVFRSACILKLNGAV
ncbi:hypothetical protein LJC27_08460, partial [Christensenellaceae bacterium OttesenSCG-928-M15]|nr:hypothetical protein [Christensenellaceae bacterium OttesenSCG-928-M15]